MDKMQRAPIKASSTSTTTSSSASSSALDSKKKTIMHICEECKREFDRPEHLERHVRKHTGEKPYVCLLDTCQRRFSRYDNMLQHYRCHLQKGYRRKSKLLRDKLKQEREQKLVSDQMERRNSMSQGPQLSPPPSSPPSCSSPSSSSYSYSSALPPSSPSSSSSPTPSSPPSSPLALSSSAPPSPSAASTPSIASTLMSLTSAIPSVTTTTTTTTQRVNFSPSSSSHDNPYPILNLSDPFQTLAQTAYQIKLESSTANLTTSTPTAVAQAFATPLFQQSPPQTRFDIDHYYLTLLRPSLS